MMEWLREEAGGMLLFAVVGALILAFARRAYRRRGEGWKAAPSLAASMLALTFLVLVIISTRFAPLARGAFRFDQFIVRTSALLMGVVLVVVALVSFSPRLLDVLERNHFITFVGARHIRASKSGFLTVISFLSILAVSMSVCALCVVTSVMGGFGHDLKTKILGNTAHVVVERSQPGGFDDWEPTLAALRESVHPYGAEATPVAAGEAMASSMSNTAGAIIRGVDADTINKVINLEKNMEVGDFNYLNDPERLINLPSDEIVGRGPGGEPFFKGPNFTLGSSFGVARPPPKVYPGIILGRELAKSLHVLVGDELTLLSPLGDLGPAGIMPKARKFRVAGIFYSGMYEYDASHGYVLRTVAQDFFSLDNRITGIDIRVADPEQVDAIRPSIDGAIAAINARHATTKKDVKNYEPLRVRDWKEMNRSLFSALKLEKIATFIILCIAIAVASFCILCTLLLMVTEKAKEIAVLKSLGASSPAIMKIFILEGVMIGVAGTVLGVAVALAFCLGLSWSGVRLDPDVYYIDRLPVNVDLADYGLVTLAALVICTISTILPAVAGSQVRPVDGLRYE